MALKYSGMKILRIVLTTFAFTFAVVAAFASTMWVDPQSRQQVTGDQGTLMGSCDFFITTLSNCDTSSSYFCDIQEFNLRTYRYFEDAACQIPYRKP